MNSPDPKPNQPERNVPEKPDPHPDPSRKVPERNDPTQPGTPGKTNPHPETPPQPKM